MKLELTPDQKFYTDGTNLYQRVTTYLKEMLLPRFDSEAKAKEMAGNGKYALYTQAEILTEWATNSKKATDYGTEVHNFIEAYLTDNIPSYALPNAIISNLVSFLDAMQLNIIKHGYSLFVEQSLKSDELKLAGTTDLFLFDGNTLVVRDWKTNKGKPVHTAPHYGKMIYPPFSIPANDYGKHTCQLNIYARMIIECYGFSPSRVDLGINWVAPKGTIELIKHPYLPEQTMQLPPAIIILK